MANMDAFTDTTAQYLLRLAVAVAIGGLIGLEREYKGKPAGMRTNILICLGACLIMILSVETASRAGPPADPGRIAAQVVTGVGFLGAGTIIRSRVSVAGLTTAATIWFVAALGLVIGAGQFLMAGTGAALMVLTLTSLARVENRMAVSRQLHILCLRAKGRDLASVREVLKKNRIIADDLKVTRKADEVQIDIEYVAVDRKHTALVQALDGLEGVEVILHY
jgi:putative Mg2+ transporter-C (MgtC) family protein